MNVPLLSAVFTIAFTVTVGVFMIVAFVTGFDKAVHILGAIGVGFLLSLPISVMVTKRISQLTSSPDVNS